MTETPKKSHNCGQCGLRAKYDQNPKSFAGRFWRWHINWCPGWKGFMSSLPENERNQWLQRYAIRPGK